MLVGCDCDMQIRHKVAGEHISFFLPQNPFTLSSDDVRLVSGAEGGWYSCWCIQMFLVHRVLSIYINWAWRIGELIHICIAPRKSWERERESPNHANICACQTFHKSIPLSHTTKCQAITKLLGFISYFYDFPLHPIEIKRQCSRYGCRYVHLKFFSIPKILQVKPSWAINGLF